ncbi:AMP-binding protein [Streptomyces sp. NPDC048415]|uniref:AMP-dependent synthetase/ligase n=1 Tax=Streptomyces sp. NPDC048415 TaxID=3154822 RepID=UPI00341F3C7F
MTTILRLPGEPSELTLPALLLRNAEDHGELPALSWRTDDGWTTLTWHEVRHEAAVLAAGYAALGVQRGDHVLMMMGNRPEHWLSDLALIQLGAVPVTVYGTAAPEQVAHIALHSRARLAIVEGAPELARWEPLLRDVTLSLERLVVAETAEAGAHRTYASLKRRDTADTEWRETAGKARRDTADEDWRDTAEQSWHATADEDRREARDRGVRGGGDEDRREARGRGVCGGGDEDRREARGRGVCGGGDEDRREARGRGVRGGVDEDRREARDWGVRGGVGGGRGEASGEGWRTGVDGAWREIRSGDPLTVVYTSGTTGDPKGVRVTHRNVVLNALALDRLVELPDHVEHISYLPFAHIAERMLGIYLPVFRASHVYLCPDPTQVGAVARELHPAQFFGVPRVWEKFASALRAAVAGLPEERRAAVDAAMETARARVACRERGEEPSVELAQAYRAAKEQVLDPILALAGFDRLAWTASASAPLPPDVVAFWAGFGFAIMDAWGLTETIGVATTNSPAAFRLGSVGKPLDGVELRVAEDGEILVRGATVFDGYLRADGSLDEARDANGWFATGDIGRIDEDGFLWLTDRKKEMIVTSAGKNVSPALVENALKEHPLIGQAYVHGDGRSYLVALLVPDAELAATVEPAALREEIAGAVERANARLSRPEQIKRYRVLDEEWSPESGELTPSLKLRRAAIRAHYKHVIEDLYTS